jgi:hypothetical protein
MTEAQIQKTILQWAAAKRILMFRINVIGTPLHKKGVTVYRPSTNRGMADIHATVLVGKIPVSVWLEVKRKRGKLSMYQEAFRDSVQAAGGYYFLVRSIEDVELALAEVSQKTIQQIREFIPF